MDGVLNEQNLSSREVNALSILDTGDIIPLVLLEEQWEDSSDEELRMALVG